MGRGYDVEGAIIGAASHDAAVIVSAMLTGHDVSSTHVRDEALAAYEWWREALLASNRAAQAASLTEPGAAQGGDFVMGWGKHKGLTLAEIHALPGDDGKQDGASYLTWVVANSDDRGVVAQVRAFLSSRSA